MVLITEPFLERTIAEYLDGPAVYTEVKPFVS